MFRKLIFLTLLGFFIQTAAQSSINVYFDADSSELKESDRKKIDSIAKLPTTKLLELYGYADVTGETAYNKVLSEKRVEAVSQYLKNLSANKFTVVKSQGFGETKQINNNSTLELRERNRRVEIIINPLPKEMVMDVEKLQVNRNYRLSNINFEPGRHVWLEESNRSIRDLLELLKKNPSLKIEIQGHICCSDEELDGMDMDMGTRNLSVTRALAIKNYLIDHGVEASRLQTNGYARKFPLVKDEVREEDRVANRRVEIKILDK